MRGLILSKLNQQVVRSFELQRAESRVVDNSGLDTPLKINHLQSKQLYLSKYFCKQFRQTETFLFCIHFDLLYCCFCNCKLRQQTFVIRHKGQISQRVAILLFLQYLNNCNQMWSEQQVHPLLISLVTLFCMLITCVLTVVEIVFFE